MATTRHTRKGKTRRHVHQTNNGSLTKVKIRGK